MGSKESFSGKKTWENYYWYYYKWYIIGIIALAISIAICVSQCASRVEPDYYVVYCSEEYTADNVLNSISDELQKHSTDLNGDGEINVQVINCSYGNTADNQKTAARQQAVLQLQSENSVLWIMDETAIDLYYKSENIDVFGTSDCFNQYENHAVMLKDTTMFDAVKEYIPYADKLSVFAKRTPGKQSVPDYIQKVIEQTVR